MYLSNMIWISNLQSTSMVSIKKFNLEKLKVHILYASRKAEISKFLSISCGWVALGHYPTLMAFQLNFSLVTNFVQLINEESCLRPNYKSFANFIPPQQKNIHT